jgi:ferredoxin-NADP reductase/Na+-transporting NADH:ubiquinone oxidoreductase subunit NqrB
MKPLKFIDKQLNNITMYRLVVYVVSFFLASAVILSVLHRLPLQAMAIVASSVVILTVCFIADRLLPVIFGAASNKNSSLITSLILCCILPPSTSVHQLAVAALGGVIAITSKYVLVRHYKHLFNPAAVAALILGLTGWLPATWWIGSPALVPITVVLGLLVLRKTRRFQLFLSFLVASLVVAISLGLAHHQSMGYILATAIKSSPLIFLGTIMLTEPSTTPPRVWQQRIYGLLVGALFTSQLRFGTVSATPELALILGNIYAYIVSPKYKLRLLLKKREQLAPQLYEFSFTGADKLAFEPGQYLEWTMALPKSDSRGNRRTFSIASAPHEPDIHIAIKVSDKSSSFKTSLLALRPGDAITAGQLSGDFIMPKNLDQKLVFCAGGIGITPFVAMAKTMIKTQQTRDIVLFYFLAAPTDFCYQELWKEAAAWGIKVIPVLGEGAPGWTGLVGRLDSTMLRTYVADFKERRYYISGPPGLVDNYSKLLRRSGIGQQNIVTDYFSGY